MMAPPAPTNTAMPAKNAAAKNAASKNASMAKNTSAAAAAPVANAAAPVANAAAPVAPAAVGGRRKTRKASPWNLFVKKIYGEMKRKHGKGASFGDALKEASRRKKDM